ncbi:hypothetical protein [Roseobacter weihaiensis]|uniref:hypothetical protein n=1 Tax=Roseobacter weihaiensis TaxID=2763262 RepID=UPI001D0B091B|nr:hypothetical protein [Roseobacter sp. H9]
MAKVEPLAPRPFPCMVCGVEPAPYGLGWPGFKDARPAAIRNAGTFRHCGSVECNAQGIARMQTAARTPFPWSSTLYPKKVRDRVAEITGEPPPRPPAPSPPKPQPPANDKQGLLL